MAAVDVNRVPGWKRFFKGSSRPEQHGQGKHYGDLAPVGPNTRLEHLEGEAGADERLGAHSPGSKGKITVPNNPIQIADAALYLCGLRRAQDQGPV